MKNPITITWNKVFEIYKKNYEVDDEEDEFITCEECGEPIYKDDYSTIEFDTESQELICPICGFRF